MNVLDQKNQRREIFHMSQGDPDIRQQVEDNRGMLKKLQLLIPGLRGYRQKEDIRVSDELLRNQMADKLDHAKMNMDVLRKKMVVANDITNLAAAGPLIWQIQMLSGEVRHAAQGYAGWVAPIQVNEDKLNKLYEYDYAFVSSVLQLESDTAPGKLVYDPTSASSIQTALSQFAQAVNDIRQKWSVRVEAIEGIAIQ